MQHETNFASSIDLQAPELHDFRDMPKIRPNRVLAAVVVVAAILTAGHFIYPSNSFAPAASAAIEATASQG